MTSKPFEEEEILGKAYDGRLMRRLAVFVLPYWRFLLLGLALMLAGTLVELVPPYLFSLAIDGPIARREAAGIWPYFALFVGARLVALACRYGQNFVMQSTGQRVMVDIRMRIFSHLQHMSLVFFDRNPVGRLITRITNDVDALNSFLTQGMVALLSDSFKVIFIVLTMLLLNWRMALISCIMLPFVIMAARFFQRTMRWTFRESRLRLSRINGYLNEQITGILITQLFGREPQSRARFAELNQDYNAAQFRSLRTAAIFFPVVSFLAVMATALLLNLGGRLVLGGLATLGLLVAYLQYTDQTFQPIRQIAENYNTLQSAVVAAERIFRLLDTQAEVVDVAEPAELPQPVRGEIVFKDVIFGYNPAEPVLKGISLHIPAGQAVAVVGATGAGKTSLVGVLARFYDIQQGTITLDGVDIRQLRQAELRHHIAAVPQDPTCFSGTIASNIRLHDESIRDEQVRWAAELANAARFIERLPGGYDYEVRERGSNLSGGQRQLLAFARALAFNPEVLLILDEATSSVDTETEELIQAALERLMRGRTSIVIAHRLSTIRHVDRIIVLHHGRVVEDGTHEELLALRGYYHRLYQLQFSEQVGAS
jgi:ATP-binding cassette subfamily B multidrug efflux pump